MRTFTHSVLPSEHSSTALVTFHCTAVVCTFDIVSLTYQHSPLILTRYYTVSSQHVARRLMDCSWKSCTTDRPTHRPTDRLNNPLNNTLNDTLNNTPDNTQRAKYSCNRDFDRLVILATMSNNIT